MQNRVAQADKELEDHAKRVNEMRDHTEDENGRVVVDDSDSDGGDDGGERLS